MFAVHPRGRLLFLLLSFPRFFPFAFSLAPLFFLLPDWSKRGVACRGSRGAHSTTAIIHHCVFIDECGYNIWTARNHGRARLGERAYRQVCGQRDVTVALAVSPVNGLVFHSAFFGGMNAPRFNDFLAQTRQNLDPDEEFIFIYDGAPAHRNPAIPAANTELEKLPA